MNPLPEVDNGLHIVRWKVAGFDEMRESALLDRKARFELVDGLVLHRDAGSPQHDRVVAELARRLEDECPPFVRVSVAHELRFHELDSVVTPDIVVGEVDRPQLVVEVSDDAPRLDAQEKPRLYARAGVETYWHIDLAWRFMQIHASPHPDGRYGMRLSGPSDQPLPSRDSELPAIVLDELLAAADVAA